MTGPPSFSGKSISLLAIPPSQKASPSLPVPACSLGCSDDWCVSLNREEIEKQKAKERYMKMHLAGKTEQAKADLARLAIIRKQREEAARKKEEERKG